MMTYKENDMGVKDIINRLYAYKDESNDERLNDLIDDTIKLIIDLKAEKVARPTATSSTEVPWWKGE